MRSGGRVARSLRSLSVALAGLLVARSASAFGGDEHERAARASLQLACVALDLGADCAQGGRLGDPTAAAALASLMQPLGADCDVGPEPPGFEWFTRAVDFVDDPLRLLRPRPHGTIGSAPSSGCDLDTDFLVETSRSFSTRIRALHNNVNHFQDLLLHALSSHYRSARHEAVQAAALRGNGGARQHSLYLAMIESAIALHYLGDAFAPGHIAAPREAYPDYPANAFHDRYNSRGRVFAPAADVDGQLREVLRVVDRCLGKADGEGVCGKGGALELLGLDDARRLQGARDRLRQARLILFRGDGDLLSPSRFGVDIQTDGSVALQAVAVEGREVDCASPNCAEESEAQRLLLAVVGAEIVREVLCDYLSDCRDDEPILEAYRWEPMRRTDSKSKLFFERVEMPRAVFPFGEYVRESDTRMRAGFMGLFEAGGVALVEGSRESGRGFVGMEWVPIGVPPGGTRDDEYVPKSSQNAIALGAAYRFSEESGGWDLSARWYYVVTNLDLHFSAGARLSRLELDRETTMRWVPELRFGKTYGFYGLFVGASREYQVVDDRLARAAWSFHAGVQAALPWWRIARWTNDRFHMP